MIKATRLAIPDVVLLEPVVHEDERGYFFESYNKREFDRAIGRAVTFVQDNQSQSKKNVLRGLHYQAANPQAKLVRVVVGEIFDVAVDIRKGSPTYGQWVAEILSAENKRQLWIPEGFAHGYLVTSNFAEVLYKATSYYQRDLSRRIRWSDADLNINWPLKNEKPILSVEDTTLAKNITEINP